MPELPEVQTIITDLEKVLPGLKITDFWSDIPSFRKIEKEVVGKKILRLERRGKNILIVLSENKIIVMHLRMTGHLLYGKWKLQGKEWKSLISGPLLEDLQNRFIHLIFSLSNGKQLALSDLRKFAKVIVWPAGKLNKLPEIAKLGPEPLALAFSCGKFREILREKSGKIKVVLMNQEIIAGIGNIYSDEILWEAGIHPLSRTERLDDNDLKRIFNAIKKVLNKAINAKGDSMSDYRRPSGEKGGYQKIQNAYHMTGQRCRKKDGGIIKRMKIGGRSAHFCPIHQKVR